MSQDEPRHRPEPMIDSWLGEVSGFSPADSTTMPQAASRKHHETRPVRTSSVVFDHPSGLEPSAAPASGSWSFILHVKPPAPLSNRPADGPGVPFRSRPKDSSCHDNWQWCAAREWGAEAPRQALRRKITDWGLLFYQSAAGKDDVARTWMSAQGFSPL
jgi:hypothetical protein